MEYTKLGNTGMDVSQICLGCMGFGDAERWVHKWVRCVLTRRGIGYVLSGPGS
jgi:aryl-alcohol dehydrogenase-like predicted oxidoreductase